MSTSSSVLAQWLSGAGFSSLTPTQPGWSALTPAQPGWSALTPVDPYAALAGLTPVQPGSKKSFTPVQPGGQGSWAPVDPWVNRVPLHAQARPTPAPLPRGSIDPAWVFASAEALTAQALRRSNAKVVRLPDHYLSPSQLFEAANVGRRLAGTHLWRWSPEFRVKTVACELISRTQVVAQTVLVLRDIQQSGKGYQFSAETLFSLEPPWPPVYIADQIDKVLRAVVEREDRLPEILSQAAGFWPFYESIIGFSLDSAPSLAEVLAVGEDWVIHVLMALKHACAIHRPVQSNSLVLPVIATPGHGSLPSGHATTAAFTSELLRLLVYGGKSLRAQQLDRLARRIAFNRVVAGVHFPVDSQVGYALGTQLARMLAAWAGVPRRVAPACLRATDILVDDFTLPEDGSLPAERRGVGVVPLPNVQALWRQAQAEVQLLVRMPSSRQGAK